MADQLGIPRDHAVGLCVRFWSWVDHLTEDGKVAGLKFHSVDDEMGIAGFADAMASVGWLGEIKTGGIVVPAFQKHNGTSTKFRLSEAKRKSERRLRVSG